MEKHYEVYLLIYASFLSTIIPLTIGIYTRKYFTPAVTVIFYLMCASFVSEAFMLGMQLCHLKNLIAIRLYTLAEFSLISLFFIKAIPSQKIRLLIKLMIPVFFMVAAGDFYMNGSDKMDDLTTALESILLMLYSVIAFYYLVVDPAYSNILSSPHFWFYAAILMFFACDMFIFIFSNYVQHHYPSISYKIWSIHFFDNIIFHLFISVGLWKTRTR